MLNSTRINTFHSSSENYIPEKIALQVKRLIRCVTFEAYGCNPHSYKIVAIYEINSIIAGKNEDLIIRLCGVVAHDTKYRLGGAKVA